MLNAQNVEALLARIPDHSDAPKLRMAAADCLAAAQKLASRRDQVSATANYRRSDSKMLSRTA